MVGLKKFPPNVDFPIPRLKVNCCDWLLQTLIIGTSEMLPSNYWTCPLRVRTGKSVLRSIKKKKGSGRIHNSKCKEISIRGQVNKWRLLWCRKTEKEAFTLHRKEGIIVCSAHGESGHLCSVHEEKSSEVGRNQSLSFCCFFLQKLFMYFCPEYTAVFDVKQEDPCQRQLREVTTQPVHQSTGITRSAIRTSAPLLVPRQPVT